MSRFVKDSASVEILLLQSLFHHRGIKLPVLAMGIDYIDANQRCHRTPGDLFLASGFGVNLFVLQKVAQVLGQCDHYVPPTCEPDLDCAVLLQLCSEPFVIYLILAHIREKTYKTDIDGYGGNPPGKIVW